MISTSISESKDRVKSALLTNGFKFPPLKITVNLSPSEINKKGTHFDLAIALQIALLKKKYWFWRYIFFWWTCPWWKNKRDKFYFSNSSIFGKTRINKKVLVCQESAEKLSNIQNLQIYSVKNLEEAIVFSKSKIKKIFYMRKDFRV